MRILSMLAKGGGTGTGGKKKEDTFGMKDEDWDTYKTVSKVRWDFVVPLRFHLIWKHHDLIICC